MQDFVGHLKTNQVPNIKGLIDKSHIEPLSKKKRVFENDPESLFAPKDVRKSFTKAHDDLLESNANLENKLRISNAKLEIKQIEIDNLKKSHRQRLAACEEKIETLQKKINDSEKRWKNVKEIVNNFEKLEKNHEEMVEKKDMELQQALAEAKNKYKEYEAKIVEAMGNKYCIECGNAHTADIYICNPKCLQFVR